MSKTFGLDFGTTNSVLAVPMGQHVELVDIDPTSKTAHSLRSVIFFDEEGGITIGDEAIRQYLEYGGAYGRFLQSIKAFLPNKTFTDTYIFGKRYELEDLIALILKTVKHRGELHVGHVVNSVILGRPVVFSENRELDLLAEERLQTAARRAGFTNIQFVYEPIAATLSHEERLAQGEEQLVLMGDVGGGTSDFVVMRLHGGASSPLDDRSTDILATGGVYVGGDDFDAAIMWERLAKYFGRGMNRHGSSPGQILEVPNWLPRTLCQWHMIPRLRDRKTLEIVRSLRGVTEEDRTAIRNLHTLIIDNLGFMLFRQIEAAKIQLSKNEHARIDFNEHEIVIHEEVTQQQFADMTTDLRGKIRGCALETMSRASVSPQQIDAVLITGGSSLIPSVRNVFVELFGQEKLLPVDAFTSVAYGLGLTAAIA